MSQSPQQNRRIHLASRPHGAPTPDNFRVENAPVPSPEEGQLLLRTVYLSLDPYMRGRMSEGPSYAPPMEIDEVMVGGTVSRVVESRHPDFRSVTGCSAATVGRTMPSPMAKGCSSWQAT